jgi:hypothetical protein
MKTTRRSFFAFLAAGIAAIRVPKVKAVEIVIPDKPHGLLRGQILQLNRNGKVGKWRDGGVYLGVALNDAKQDECVTVLFDK